MRIAIVSAWSPINVAENDDDLPIALIRKLRGRSDSVSILTTCASRPEEPWDAARYEPGEFEIEGMRVQRFRIDKRDVRRFAELDRLLQPPENRNASARPLLDAERSELIATSINSTPLLSHLARHADDYDAVVFLASFSGVVLRGWRIAQAHTVIAGTIANDRSALFRATRAMMLGARGVLLESEAAETRARSFYGPGILAHSAVFGTPDDIARTIDRVGRISQTSPHESAVSPTIRTAAQVVHHLARAEYAESQTVLALGLNALLNRNGYRSSVTADERDERLGTQVEPATADSDAETVRVVYGAIAAQSSDDRASATVTLGGTLPMLRRADGNHATIPLFVDLDAWNIEPARKVTQPLSDGRTNLLCLGDVAPQQRVLELVEIFRHYRLLDVDARLVVVGRVQDLAYAALVRAYVDRCGLGDRVQLLGTLSQPALAAVYRTARAFVSLRDRYETGLSLLEAMAFNVPICARDVPTARALTEGKTVLFSGLRHPIQVAALWRALTLEGALRERVISAQSRYLRTRTAERTLRVLESAIGSALDVARV